VGIGLSATYLTCGIVSVLLARSVVKASFRDLVASVVPSALSAIVAFAVVFPFEHLVVRSDRYSEPMGLGAIVVDCVLFAAIYIGVTRLVAPTRYRSIRGHTEPVAMKLIGSITGRGK
jgi:PST family polysaccharide transporter